MARHNWYRWIVSFAFALAPIGWEGVLGGEGNLSYGCVVELDPNFGSNVPVAPSHDSSSPDPSHEVDPSCIVPLNNEAPLEPVPALGAISSVAWDTELFGLSSNSDSSGQERNSCLASEDQRTALVQAIDYSLAYLGTEAAADAYSDYMIGEISRDRVQQSLLRFRHLVLTSNSPTALQAAVLEEFEFYQAVGNDGLGTVEFTGYFAPTYTASAVPTTEYRYPLYRPPSDLASWVEPHPTRLQLEGANGLEGDRGGVGGLELVWMRDRLEAFLVQVQGSAQLQLTDGRILTVGYAGRTNYPYTSLGRLLITDGKIAEENLSLPVVLEYFRQHPEELNYYLPQNDRFVFFEPTAGAPPMGSLNQPVTCDRSIATDKSLMPPGALALIHTALPSGPSLEPQVVTQYVLDQDTGGAIRGPGRVDIFMGIGNAAGERAGLTRTFGQMYYLILKDTNLER